MEIIEMGEIEDLLRSLSSQRRMTCAVIAALQHSERQIAAAQRLLRVVEFRKTYAGGDSNED